MTKTIEWGCTPTTNRLRMMLCELDDFPDQGPCPKKYTKNKALERFRRAQNVVYDIFCNGLMNRGKQLKILGLRRYDLALEEWRGCECIVPANWDRIEDVVEERFTPIIMAAAREQGLIK